MSALKAYLNGFGDMVKAKSDLDRLLYMPQRLEDGEIFNFKNKSMFGIMDNLSGLELEVIDAKRVIEATRYTSALQRDYFEGFDKLMKLIDGEVEDVVEEADIKEVDPVTKLYNHLYEVVAAGDKKAFRTLRKDLKDQWFALDDTEVEDAIFDLSDAVADKDVDFAKEIVEGLGGTEEVEDDIVEEETPADTVAEEEGNDTLESEVSEIIEDIKSAIDDGDEEDFKELIAELKDIDKKAYNEWKDAFSTQDDTVAEEDENDEVVEEILEDLSIAIKEEDSDEIKELLEELADEVGEDSELYQEWFTKVAPKKSSQKEKRSRRRGK